MSRHAHAHAVTAPTRRPGRSIHRSTRSPGPPRSPLLVLAAFASLGAGVVHAAVAPEHRDWWASVAFFGALATFQIGWALLVLVRSPSPRILLLGAAANLGALATWAISRTAGMPVGPTQGEAEPLARADALASVLGAVVVAAALGAARRRRPAPRVAWLRPRTAAGASGVLVSAMSIVALTGVSGHAHPAGGGHGEHAVQISGDSLAAAAVESSTPGVAAAAKACARATTLAAELAQKAKAKPGAKAKAAVRKQEGRVLAACEQVAAAMAPEAGIPGTQKAPAENAESELPHDESDGHSH